MMQVGSNIICATSGFWIKHSILWIVYYFEGLKSTWMLTSTLFRFLFRIERQKCFATGNASQALFDLAKLDRTPDKRKQVRTNHGGSIASQCITGGSAAAALSQAPIRDEAASI